MRKLATPRHTEHKTNVEIVEWSFCVCVWVLSWACGSSGSSSIYLIGSIEWHGDGHKFHL